MFLRFIRVVAYVDTLLFVIAKQCLMCGYPKYCSPVHPLVNSWVASSSWLLGIMHIQGHLFAYLLDMHLRGRTVESYGTSVFNFLSGLEELFSKVATSFYTPAGDA